MIVMRINMGALRLSGDEGVDRCNWDRGSKAGTSGTLVQDDCKSDKSSPVLRAFSKLLAVANHALERPFFCCGNVDPANGVAGKSPSNHSKVAGALVVTGTL